MRYWSNALDIKLLLVVQRSNPNPSSLLLKNVPSPNISNNRQLFKVAAQEISVPLSLRFQHTLCTAERDFYQHWFWAVLRTRCLLSAGWRKCKSFICQPSITKPGRQTPNPRHLAELKERWNHKRNKNKVLPAKVSLVWGSRISSYCPQNMYHHDH